MAYNKTNWQNLPDTSTPLSANNLNKIENELEKLDPSTPYTTVEGTYTTAEWGEGTATDCTWTAPRSGLYLVFAYFNNHNDSPEEAKSYKQFQLRGTATRVVANRLLYQTGSSAASASAQEAILSIQIPTLISATTGQTVVPYIFTATAGIVWDVKIVGLFLK